MKLVVIDPRRTETAHHADIHLQPKPGEDVAVLAGLLHVILAEGLEDAEFVAANTSGVDALRAAVAPYTPEVVAARADIDRDDARRRCARCSGRRSVGSSARGTGPEHGGLRDADRVPRAVPRHGVRPLAARGRGGARRAGVDPPRATTRRRPCRRRWPKRPVPSCGCPVVPRRRRRCSSWTRSTRCCSRVKDASGRCSAWAATRSPRGPTRNEPSRPSSRSTCSWSSIRS